MERQPFNYDTERRELTCSECGKAVAGVLVPISGRERPRAWPEGSEVIVDVVVDGARGVLHPCGHQYQTDGEQLRHIGEARPEA